MTIFLLVLLSLFPVLGHAAFVGPPSTSAGVVEREIQQEFVESHEVSPDKPAPLLDVELPQQQLNLDAKESVYVAEIKIQGNCCLSEKALQELLRCYTGKEITISEIYQACSDIQQAYACKGYFLARAYPPEQDIENGVLTLEVLEGCLGEIIVEGNCYYKQCFIRSYFTRFQNCAINYDKFIEALLLVNEHMDLTVGAVFKKGERYGTADVILKVVDCRPRHLYFNSNNYGSKSTTNQRTGGRLDYGNLFLSGDKFTLAQVVGSPIKELLFTEASYKVPISRRGTDLKLAYLHSEFDVGILNQLELGGRTDIGVIKLTQALKRTRRFNADLYVHGDYKEVRNRALGKTSSFDKLRNVGGGLTFDWVDGWCGRNIGDLHAVVGIPDIIGGSPAVNPLSSRAGAGSKFVIYSLDFTRVQSLFCDTFLILQGYGQYSVYKLPYAEAIYIGGADATRGYKVAAAIGDYGYYGTVELRMPPPFIKCCKVPFSRCQWKDTLQLVFFYDRGQVWFNGGDITAQKSNIPLNGVGAGVRLFGPWNFEFSYDLAFGLTGEKKPSNTVHYFKVNWKAF